MLPDIRMLFLSFQTLTWIDFFFVANSNFCLESASEKNWIHSFYALRTMDVTIVYLFLKGIKVCTMEPGTVTRVLKDVFTTMDGELSLTRGDIFQVRDSHVLPNRFLLHLLKLYLFPYFYLGHRSYWQILVLWELYRKGRQVPQQPTHSDWNARSER